jgi:hypothetical protein
MLHLVIQSLLALGIALTVILEAAMGPSSLSIPRISSSPAKLFFLPPAMPTEHSVSDKYLDLGNIFSAIACSLPSSLMPYDTCSARLLPMLASDVESAGSDSSLVSFLPATTAATAADPTTVTSPLPEPTNFEESQSIHSTDSLDFMTTLVYSLPLPSSWTTVFTSLVYAHIDDAATDSPSIPPSSLFSAFPATAAASPTIITYPAPEPTPFQTHQPIHDDHQISYSFVIQMSFTIGFGSLTLLSLSCIIVKV